MAIDDRRWALPSELGVAALVVAASIPLGRLFRTGDVFATAFSAAVVSTAVAWGLRRLRAPALVSVAASLAAFLWFASWSFFRSTMFGPFPTPHSFATIWHATGQAIRHSQSDVAPVAATPEFLCLSAFAVWATAWLADDAAIKLRHPMLAIGVTIPLYVLPGTIIEGGTRWFDAGMFLAASLWVLFSDERFRLSRWGRVVGSGVPGWRPGLAARMGLVAIVLALVASPILPGFGAPPGLQGITGTGNRATLNPLVTIRPQLGAHDRVDVFTVRSRSVAYWRLTALDRFDGLSWTSGPQRPVLQVSGRSIAPQNPDAMVRVVQSFEIKALGGPWMPAAYEPIRVDGIRGAAADPETRTLISAHDLRRGLRYQVTSRVPELSYEGLDQAPPPAEASLRPYLLLPAGDQTRRIAQITRQVIAAAHVEHASVFRQAVALQNYLRTFTYDENVALGHTISDIADFLQNVRAGYCEQFATAMAVMARTLGLPTRVAIGFAGGTPGNTPDQLTVTTRNAHAWVEIWMEGYGWVQFEPTPRTDSVVVPSYTTPSRIDVGPLPTPSSAASPPPTASPRPKSPDVNQPSLEKQATGSFTKPLVWIGLVTGSLLVLLAVAFPIAAGGRRALRRRGARTPEDHVAISYLDLLDWCAATGRGRRAGETPLEHARRLAEASSDQDASLTALAGLAVDAAYAPPNGIDAAGASRLAKRSRAGMASSLSRRRRVLFSLGWGWWRLDPASRPPGRNRAPAPVAFR